MAAIHSLPSLPAKHEDFIGWINNNQATPIAQLIKPYNEHEAVVRKLFAQEPSHPALRDNHLNIVPLYDTSGKTIVPSRPRDPSSESPDLQEKYVMPLKAESRRAYGDPAVVSSLEDFRNNFNIFSEGSLSDMDWNNVVVAGSAVVTCLMPVPEEYRGSKRALRQFYHDKYAPASDVDLFLYGLTEEQAIEKIKQIEDKIKNAILYETTTIRTKNTITIVSQYPTRHVQIVLRIYKSISEILTGFDVDCSCAAFDGKQVYASPRALAAYITQTNTIDLTRRSPSYENRLSKYSHRGFEIFCPQLERCRVDPTIYERSFSRTVGLARLLVLERLPKSSDRDAYLEQRREERGRPARQQQMRSLNSLNGNIKSDWEDEIPEWMEGDEYSDYHTMTIPYGPKFHAKRIERLVYTKDLLLNAEWNKPKDRDVNLHRHPAFFGNVEDVIHDCCGYCPEPVTPEEKEVAEKESKNYISGDISFIKDDPGRQEIGSFNPITETDWTEMAYVGNTEQLCQAIVDHDLAAVKEWLSQDERDPNSRDYTGRTPLHLACLASTPDIVQCLVDHGARLISRLADGRTALHIAAARGSVEIIRILLHRSEENEAEEDKRQELRKAKAAQDSQHGADEAGSEPEDIESVAMEEDATSYTSGSFVKVQKEGDDATSAEGLSEDENGQEPDIYDINAVSWDSHTSPLHLAILNGHVDVVEELVASFGADVLLPIKLLNSQGNSSRGAILTLVLTLQLPLEKAKAMSKKLLQLGASPAQADLKYNTPLHYIAASTYDDLIDVFLDQNKPVTLKAINHLAFVGYSWNPDAYSAFMTAINTKNPIGALKLLEAGAEPSIDFGKFVKSGQVLDSIRTNSSERNREIFRHNFTQPIVLAIQKELPEVALELVTRGVDPNTLSPDGYEVEDDDYVRDSLHGKSLLDCVRDKIKEMQQYQGEVVELTAPRPLEPDSFYLKDFEANTYQLWTAERELSKAKRSYKKSLKVYEQGISDSENRKGVESKLQTIRDLVEQFKKLETVLSEKGAKTFKELFPDLQQPDDEDESSSPNRDCDDPFKLEFTFNISDLTDEKKDGYIKLFEAAWNGDLDTIRSLTLAMWGEGNGQPPLQIAITDSNRLSPFSIATLRGHRDVAKAILEIVQAQYKKEEPSGHERFEMGSDCGSEDSEDSGNPRIYSEVVDDKFTIDDIGEVATQVECHITPLQVLNWYCPKSKWFISPDVMAKCRESPFGKPSDLLEYAIWMDDVKLLVFLLKMGEELASKDTDSEFAAFGVPNKTVHLAIAEGRLRCLEELIRRTGADLPLDALVQESGVQVHEKSGYYQGLSIHGKKRADWAAAGRGHLHRHTNKSSPLLVSAVLGSLKSTEWYMSTAPSRHYVEFSETHEQDHRLKLLAKSTSGIEKSIVSWLNAKNNLVLHCAILSTPTLESRRLVEYLVREVPECLETRSAGRYTPLALAYSLNRADYADILIKAGASQTVRDSRGNNLIHLLLCGIDGDTSGKPGNIERLLGLLDPRLAPSLLVERSSDEPGSVTPFARWMHHAYFNGSDADRLIDIARILLEFAESTGQKHLELLDGTGNTPVHYAVKHELVQILELMIDRRPDLLYRENATGSTPLELEEDAWTLKATSDPPSFRTLDRSWNGRWITDADMVDVDPESFLPDLCPPEKSLRDVCHERASGRPEKRKLVTLNEANEVAKRLAAQKSSRWGQRQSQGFTETDQVARWYGRSDREDELADVMEI